MEIIDYKEDRETKEKTGKVAEGAAWYLYNNDGGLYVECKAGERIFLENVEWKMTKVLAVILEKRWACKM